MKIYQDKLGDWLYKGFYLKPGALRRMEIFRQDDERACRRNAYAREHGICLRCKKHFEPDGHTLCPRCQSLFHKKVR